MEKNLEHKIAKAIQNKDASIKYPRKEELWSRISNAQKSKTAVYGFWRVAAILTAVFFMTGAFAGILFVKNNMKQIAQVERYNEELHVIIDSLQNITPLTITDTIYIEKEVKVFVPGGKILAATGVEKEQIATLKQENMLLKNQFRTESEIWQNKADSLAKELVALNSILKENIVFQNKEKNSVSNVVELKPEKYETPLQQPTPSVNPKMKLQLFSNPAEKSNFDMNSTIFKK